MNIAVFSDIHGRLLLCFKLVERYQRETGQHIDLIFQCGDIGIFPDPKQLDKATTRFAKADNTELGFRDYFTKPRKDVEAILSKTDCSLICVRGNHEDHAYLDKLENQTDEALFPVDYYKRIYVLKTGIQYKLVLGNTQLNLLGIGRVGPPASEAETTKTKYIQEYEKQRLSKLDEHTRIDILLTHDSAKDFIAPGFGMQEIQTCLDKYKPIYHFYGHTGNPYQRKIDSNGVTMSAKMSDLEWKETTKGQVLKPGCLGILNWKNNGDHTLNIVKESWLNEYTPQTWKYL